MQFQDKCSKGATNLKAFRILSHENSWLRNGSNVRRASFHSLSKFELYAIIPSWVARAFAMKAFNSWWFTGPSASITVTERLFDIDSTRLGRNQKCVSIAEALLLHLIADCPRNQTSKPDSSFLGEWVFTLLFKYLCWTYWMDDSRYFFDIWEVLNVSPSFYYTCVFGARMICRGYSRRYQTKFQKVKSKSIRAKKDGKQTKVYPKPISERLCSSRFVILGRFVFIVPLTFPKNRISFNDNISRESESLKQHILCSGDG